MKSKLPDIWSDLRRRQVFQVAAIYATVAWAAVQVAETVTEALYMPGWVMTAIVIFSIIGFPVTVILAWLFDIAPDGMHRTEPGSAAGVLTILASLGLLGAGTAGFVWLVVPNEQNVEGETRLEEFTPAANSIAVLPFDDLSSEDGFAHISDGIADTLITKLSQISSLHVIARKSSFAFKGKDIGVDEIARKLGVAHLLEGSVQRSGNRLRISTKLIDAKTGRNVWSDLFDRKSADVFAVQDDIARAVAAALRVSTENDKILESHRPISDSFDAYELYLLGRHKALNSDLDDGLADAIHYYERALELDPEMAAAWAGLASARFWNATRGKGNETLEEAITASWEASNRAIEIDPQFGESYAHRILLHGINNDAAAQREAYELAVRYSPSFELTYVAYGLVLNNRNEFDKALEVLGRGLEIEPFEPNPWLTHNLGRAYCGIGDYEQCMRLHGATYLSQLGLETEGQFLRAMGHGAYQYHRFDEAAALFAMAHRDGHDSVMSRAVLASTWLMMDRDEQALLVLRDGLRLLEEQQSASANWNPAIPLLDHTRVMLGLKLGDQQPLHELADALTSELERSPELLTARMRSYDASMFNLLASRFEEAVYTATIMLETGADAENIAIAALANQRDGNPAKAKSILQEGRRQIDEDLSRPYFLPYEFVGVADYFAVAGETDAAIDMLEKAFDAGYRDIVYLQHMPLLDSIRHDPRFQQIMRLIRADVGRMRERIEIAQESGDFESIVAKYLVK
jgi:TolB-like protein/Tfp pilus assembly protein PilF